MRRRGPISGAAFLAALLSGVLPVRALPGDGIEPSGPDRLMLICSGTMIADGGESVIQSRGTLDLAEGRIAGFGVGTADIVLVTAAAVGFDTLGPATVRLARASVSDAPIAARKQPATITRGTFNRGTGALHIAVSSARSPGTVVIEMRLACTGEPALR